MTEGNGFSAQALLGATRRRYREFEVPPFGKYRIRSLTERERSQMEGDQLSKKGEFSKQKLMESRRRLIAWCLVDGDGERLIGDDQIPQLEEVDSLLTAAIYDACLDHCGFSDADIEDLAKNSEKINVS